MIKNVEFDYVLALAQKKKEEPFSYQILGLFFLIGNATNLNHGFSAQPV